MTKRPLESDPIETSKYERITKIPHLIDEAKTIDERDDLSPGSLTNFIKDPRMLQVLRNKGIKELFPIQFKTFELLYDGKDIIGKDRTGSGKTLAFSLPIIERMRVQKLFQQSRNPKFLIVLPTRELTIQVCSQITSLKLDRNEFSVVAVYGGADMRSQCSQIRSGVDIIVATPGRLMDLIQKGVIRFDSLQTVCLDEADEMLNQGFQKDIESIFASISKEAPKKTQNLMFSATIPPWIDEMSRKYQRDCKLIDLINRAETSGSKTVKHYCVRMDYGDQPSKIIKLLIHKFAKNDGRVIVFCETKRETDKVGTRLAEAGIRCDTLHGDVSQVSRQRTFRRFKEGTVRCVVATNVAARGLDFPCIELVVQIGPPKQIQSYIHRSGRTGRVNRQGVAVTLFEGQDERQIHRIEQQSRIVMERLKKSDLEGEKEPQRDNSQERERRRDRDEHDRHGRSDRVETRGWEDRSKDASRGDNGRNSSKDFEQNELFVHNLSQTTTQSDLMQLLERNHVNVRRITLLKDSDRKSKCCGFISLRDSKALQECLKLDRTSLRGNSIRIRNKR